MCDIQNNGKIQREFETRSTDDQPTIQWLPVVGSWTFLGVNMHFNEKLFMCDSCNFLVRPYQPNKSFKKDFVEAEELRAIFLQLPEPLSDDEMEEMLRAGNRSGGGTFNLEDMG